MLKFSRFSRSHFGEAIGKRMPVYLSSFAVWFATGIWHGASWNFIVWGLANWVVIMVSQECEPLYERFHNRFSVKGNWFYKLFQVVRTILLMGLSGMDYLILAMGLVLLLVVSLVQRKGSVREQILALPYWGRFILWYGLFLIVLLAGAYGIGYDASQFIYNQF